MRWIFAALFGLALGVLPAVEPGTAIRAVPGVVAELSPSVLIAAWQKESELRRIARASLVRARSHELSLRAKESEESRAGEESERVRDLRARIAGAARLRQSMQLRLQAARVRMETLRGKLVRRGLLDRALAVMEDSHRGWISAPFLATSALILLLGACALGIIKWSRDFISGKMHVRSGLYAKGDALRVGGFEGFVEESTRRHLVLGDGGGQQVFIPHSEVSSVERLDESFNEINVKLRASYAESLETLRSVAADAVKLLVAGSCEEDSGEEDSAGLAGKHLVRELMPAVRVVKFEADAVLLEVRVEARKLREREARLTLRRSLEETTRRAGVNVVFLSTSETNQDAPRLA